MKELPTDFWELKRTVFINGRYNTCKTCEKPIVGPDATVVIHITTTGDNIITFCSKQCYEREGI